MSSTETVDTGTGYGRPTPTYNRRLVEVGPGTPMGELMRRYWQPFARVEDATAAPKRVRLLGEDLILFRDGAGRPGLVAEHCCHRGASLFFGRVEEDGIRCCYHGWKFDVKGHCVDQATEVEGGLRREVARQPWYPIQARYGLFFAYMGPPDKKPVLPRWDKLEDLKEGEMLEVSTYPGYGPGDVLDYNWLQAFENTQDQMHAIWLHGMHSGQQFVFDQDGVLPPLPDTGDVHGAVKSQAWSMTEQGVIARGYYPFPDTNKAATFSVEAIFPNALSVPGLNDLGWIVPVDDTHHMVIQVGIVKELGDMAKRTITHDGKFWMELTEAELQKMPSDYEAQHSQGAIAFHSEEHLAQSDQGVMLVRRGLNRLLDELEAGKDPVGVSFDPQNDLRRIEAAPAALVG